MMSVQEYKRLKRRDRQVLVVDQLSAEQAKELLAVLRESEPTTEAERFDDELD